MHPRTPDEAARFDVSMSSSVGADVADMGKCEGDDLSGIGRVGQDFLIAGNGRVEANLAGCFSYRTDAVPLDDQSIGKNGGGCVGAIRPCVVAGMAGEWHDVTLG